MSHYTGLVNSPPLCRLRVTGGNLHDPLSYLSHPIIQDLCLKIFANPTLPLFEHSKNLLLPLACSSLFEEQKKTYETLQKIFIATTTNPFHIPHTPHGINRHYDGDTLFSVLHSSTEF
uniref:Uncharacterized protein n=1 Tax=Cacopsylla melanoneura TaxID=428564 RepID=A0A8D8ZE07_9HEMI